MQFTDVVCRVMILMEYQRVNLGSMSTVVGDEKLTSRENLIGFLFFWLFVNCSG